jgi:hypothetical protein
MRAKEFLSEVKYKGNIGAMEVFRFYQIADEKQKLRFKRLLKQLDAAKASKDKKTVSSLRQSAWEYIQNVTGMRLQGKGFTNENSLRSNIQLK